MEALNNITNTSSTSVKSHAAQVALGPPQPDHLLQRHNALSGNLDAFLPLGIPSIFQMFVKASPLVVASAQASTHHYLGSVLPTNQADDVLEAKCHLP